MTSVFATRRWIIAAATFMLAVGASARPISPAPANRPERVLLTFSGDPSQEIAVTWRTPADQVTTRGPEAQYVPAKPGPDLSSSASLKVVRAVETLTTVTGAYDNGDVREYRYNTAKLTGLLPATKYAYRVGNGVHYSEWNHFTTAAAPDGKVTPFSFIYVGDAQNDILSLWSRVLRDAVLRCPEARFILHAGDLVDLGNDDIEWDEWFTGAGWTNRVIPSVATPGNHEYPVLRKGEERTLSRLWKPQFEFPRNGVPGLEDTNYYFDFQGVRVISLDSNSKRQLAEQAKWLDEVLTSNPNRWTVLTFHHPIYSTAVKRDNPEVVAAWRPVVEKHKVDLVLQGHDHNYGRTPRMATGGTIAEQDKPGGSVYVVSISGPKMYDLSTATQQLMVRRGEDTQLYQVIHVEQDKLSYESRSAAGELYDAFTLTKSADGNLLTEAQNLPPERRRKPKK